MAESRPTYLGSETSDDLARISLRLLSELWTLRDRLTVVEHLLEQRGGPTREEIDAFVPEGELHAELARERGAMIRRVLEAPHESVATAPVPPPSEAERR